MTARVVTKANRKRGLVAAAAAVLLVATAACSDDSSTGSTTSVTQTTQAGTSAAGDGTQIDSAVAQRLDEAIVNTMARASIPGVMVGVWGADGNYVKAFGVADKSSGAPMETDFYSRIGSVTKTFTVTGVLQLVDEGKVGLDDPIGKYIDGVPLGDQITIRQLARMQSGLANYSANEDFQKALIADPKANFTPQQLLGYAYAQPATFPPGQGFEYSNTNTTLLGLVVEKVSGMSLADYVTQKIIDPLEMADTSFPNSNAIPEPHPQGYTEQTADGKETTATDWNPSWGWAAGAMISTLEDLHIWAPALATGTLLQPATQEQRLQTVTAPGLSTDVGYGLGIFDIAGWIGHNGSIPGYQTVSVYLPEKEMTLAIMINTDVPYEGSEPSTALATAITEIISPDHVYRLRADVQDPSATSAPSTTPGTPQPSTSAPAPTS
ncbi:serine hydrolase domain-containing protein [Rhodococcus oxybenzonivorans]|uniref:serine hydrolase domain-containing protein n=1 Tax=Rhodococcus oxybenzonivorans TaxID=1990687 RepID=UPI002955D895|nr:serine hydrolase domain-containing protein [Rhodococcus oxybenzonivorans]MDV7355395.1 serine hydrolase domain-containing protein [Rhodococcus oxybenzonivorans]